MCFSLAWIEQILIWAVVVVAVVAIIKILIALVLLGRFRHYASFEHRDVGGGRDLRDYHLFRFDLLPS